MYQLRRSMYTETAHLLKDHKGLCANFHGHSYKWTVIVSSFLLRNDMVMDFGQLKEIMNEVISPYDHAVVVDLQSFKELPEHLTKGRCIMYQKRPTAERMACTVFQRIKGMLPPDVHLVEVICRETENNEASYSEE